MNFTPAINQAPPVFAVALKCGPNADFKGHYEAEIPRVERTATCASIEEAHQIVSAFIEEFGLGGGNFRPASITKDGAPFGTITYNGKFWPVA